MKDSIFSPGGRGEKLIRINGAGFTEAPEPRFHARGSGFLFIYVMSGEATVESPALLTRAVSGNVILIHDSEECAVYGDRLSYVSFSISGYTTEAMYEIVGLDRVEVFPADRLSVFTGIVSDYKEYVSGSVSAGNRIAVAAVSLILDCASFSEAEADERPLPRRMKDFLDTSVCEDIDLDALGQKFGITGVHAIRVFRKEYNATPMQYLRDARLAAAAELLTLTDISSAEIARSLRFANPQHFSNTFKEKYSLSPGKYREAFHKMAK